MMMMSHSPEYNPAHPKLRKRVGIELSYTHSVNYEDPMIDDQETQGSLFQVDEQTYILAFDADLNGKRQTHTLKIQEDVLSWVIIGDSHTRQTFKTGEWYSNQFFADGITFTCRNKTRRLDFHFTEQGGFIDLFYELYSGETHLGYYSLEVYLH
jgi:uncharacterized beta-barrel protein YwiB (DUF1934 family)